MRSTPEWSPSQRCSSWVISTNTGNPGTIPFTKPLGTLSDISRPNWSPRMTTQTLSNATRLTCYYGLQNKVGKNRWQTRRISPWLAQCIPWLFWTEDQRNNIIVPNHLVHMNLRSLPETSGRLSWKWTCQKWLARSDNSQQQYPTMMCC